MNKTHCGSEQFWLQPLPLLNFSLFFSSNVRPGAAKKSRPAGMPDSSPLALDLAGFFKVAIAPVGMWKSGAGWANRWAGVFLPVHGFAHALEPRSGTASSCRISTYPRVATQAAGMPPEKAVGGRPAPFMRPPRAGKWRSRRHNPVSPRPKARGDEHN